MPRLLVAGASPRSPPSSLTVCNATRRRDRHPFSSILFHARLSLSSPTSLPSVARGRYTTRVSLTSSTSLSGSWVRLYALRARTSDSRRQSITSSRSQRTRTLLSPYVNELLIFRAFRLLLLLLLLPFPSPVALYHLLLICRLSRARTTRPSNVCHYTKRELIPLFFDRVAKSVTKSLLTFGESLSTYGTIAFAKAFKWTYFGRSYNRPVESSPLVKS